MAPAETLEVGEPAPTPPLSISLSPQGHVDVDAAVGSDVTSPLAQIARHFERGDGPGVFRLGASEPDTPLPGVLGFWRDVGRAFVVRLCATEDLETLRATIDVEVPPDELAALAAASPPMIGGEYLTHLSELFGIELESSTSKVATASTDGAGDRSPTRAPVPSPRRAKSAKGTDSARALNRVVAKVRGTKSKMKRD